MNDFFLKFSAPFVKSTKDTFRIMLSTEVTLHSPQLKSDTRARGDITALIGINGIYLGSQEILGILALSFSEATYLRVASRMLGEDHTSYSVEIADVGAELANIILGGSKQGLMDLGIQLALTTPTSIRGIQHEISFPSNSRVIETCVNSDLGEFFLDLCCREF